MPDIRFPNNFIWGAATASYQIEGAHAEDGKGESIWDHFSHIPGKITSNDNGDIACDHYHRYEEDVKIMKDLGLKYYRFSISWSRIFPDGKGSPNQKGIDFYKRLTNLLLENGIKPAITLYHWDLPQQLQYRGGWGNRDTADYFEQYAGYIFNQLGEYVPMWITHNEPHISSIISYWDGRHAPGYTDFPLALRACHHLLLSHGKAVQLYRSLGYKGEIGITLDLNPMYPASDTDKDKKATIRADGYENRWFADPVLKGKYPEDMVKWYESRTTLPEIKPGDMETISTPIDFLGINHYMPHTIKHDPSVWPANYAKLLTGRPLTNMDWEIYPEGSYDLLTRLHRDYNGIKLIITENGAAFTDIVNRKGEVDDDNRLDYLYGYLQQMNRAIKDGVNLAGYFVWSLMDNFEWGHGYSKRFGIVYIDFKTRQRIIKKSGHWYANVIKNNGFDLV
ncbi:MAG: GH1 family beta-glucosidase [Bacillota bacterium]|nr:GH1 family beta-glucosidase [Bacillota bacterium]